MSVLPADAYDGRRVLVTGGAGFIGSHLTDALVERGADVCVLDDLSQGLESNLESVRDRIDFVHGSLLDDEAVRKALDGAEVVFHEAAVTSVPASIDAPWKGEWRIVPVDRSSASRSASANRSVLPVCACLM